MRAVAGLLGLLAFGTQAVHSFTSITFSPIKQCGSFSVNFTGGAAPAALPLILTVVPINATPIYIDIPNESWNSSTSTGAAVTFLPFAAGTTFVASLDDATGRPTGRVSDLIRVQESEDSSCLPPTDVVGGRLFNISGTLSQCMPFNVTFDPNIVNQAPSIRAFIPRSFSFPVNASEADLGPGVQEYILDGIHGFNLVLSLDDGDGHRQSTELITVGGDSSSSFSCFDFPPPTQSPKIGASTGVDGWDALPKPAKVVVGIVCGGVVGGVAIIMALVVLRKQRRSPLAPPQDPEKRDHLPSHTSDLNGESPASPTKTFSFTEDITICTYDGSGPTSRARSRSPRSAPLAAIYETRFETDVQHGGRDVDGTTTMPTSTARVTIEDSNGPFVASDRLSAALRERPLEVSTGWRRGTHWSASPQPGRSPQVTSPSSGNTSQLSTPRGRKPCPDAPLPAVPLSPMSHIDSPSDVQRSSITGPVVESGFLLSASPGTLGDRLSAVSGHSSLPTEILTRYRPPETVASDDGLRTR